VAEFTHRTIFEKGCDEGTIKITIEKSEKTKNLTM
jgi:hypothetical protein